MSMQANISYFRGGICGLALMGAFTAHQADAVTFAAFSQPTGTPFGFQVNPDLTFTSISGPGDAVVLNFVNEGSLAGVTFAAHLTVSGELDPGTGGSAGPLLFQNFTSVNFEFWTGLNKTGIMLLKVETFGGSIVAGAPYNSAAGSSASTVFTSTIPGYQAELDNLFGDNRATAFNLNDLTPVAQINNGNLDPFVANIGGSFSATPIPEPTSLLGLGLLAGLALVSRRRA